MKYLSIFSALLCLTEIFAKAEIFFVVSFCNLGVNLIYKKTIFVFLIFVYFKTIDFCSAVLL